MITVSRLKTVCHGLGSPKILFWVLPILMLFLVIGTVAQKYIGLYRSTELFFSGWILWAGPIPLPGFFAIMTVFSINLFFRFLFKSPWRWEKAGLHLTHFGALLLVLGGLVTALTTQEGFLVIEEGDTQSIASDYNQRALVFFEDNQSMAAIPFERLRPGKTVEMDGLSVTIIDRCQNCTIKENAESAEANRLGMAKFMALTSKPEELEPEMNMTGLTLDITANGQTNRYIAFEGMPKPIQITSERNGQEKSIDILLGKEQWPLPFSLTLKDFEKINYPGTVEAKAYQSHLTFNADDVSWPVLISMNNPLRYNGYSVYQSSFDIREDGSEISVFAVVYNQGQVIAYASSLILCLGLLLHAFIHYRQRRNR